MVRGEGFEPPTFTTKGTDLQSVAEPPSLPPTHTVREYDSRKLLFPYTHKEYDPKQSHNDAQVVVVEMVARMI